MRSAFALAAQCIEIRIEVQDLLHSVSKLGLAKEETDRLSRAIDLINSASGQLKDFRFVRAVEDLPESANPQK